MTIEDLIKTVHSIKSILKIHKENFEVSRIISSFEELSDCILENYNNGNYVLQEGGYYRPKDKAKMEWMLWETADYWKFRRFHYGTYRFCGNLAGYAIEEFCYYPDENQIKCYYEEMDGGNPYPRNYCISITSTGCFNC